MPFIQGASESCYQTSDACNVVLIKKSKKRPTKILLIIGTIRFTDIDDFSICHRNQYFEQLFPIRVTTAPP